jgi:predicted aminopeptidase
MDFLKIPITLITLFLTSSCQLTYYTKSAYQQMWILTHKEPIEKTLRAKDIQRDEVKKLMLTQKVRDFAQKNLHLNIGNSYNTFVRLNKPYVVWAVNASANSRTFCAELCALPCMAAIWLGEASTVTV